MAVPFLEELRLTRFKSFRDAVLPLRDLTLVIGRNGSGKSNAIDGLHVLSRLAEGEDLREAIDGSRRDGSEVRGGIRGCVPFGDRSFALGCTVVNGLDRYKLDLEIQVEPDIQIVREELRYCPPREQNHRPYLITDEAQPGLTDIAGRYYNGKRGLNPSVPFRSDRLLTAQVPTKVPSGNQAERRVHEAAEIVLECLREIFILDPVPHLMRQYVPKRDVVLRRQAENLSAAVGELQSDTTRWEKLKGLVEALPEQEVLDIAVETSPLDDVMIALQERFGDRSVPISARVMSDGMLRFLAFSTALLQAPELAEVSDAASERANTLLVIEEIENGLHPSQAAKVVELIRQESERRLIRTLATTHSPAILSALSAADHEGVVVCTRDRATGRSLLTPLVELPSYPRALVSGTLGEAITERKLDAERTSEETESELQAFLGGL